MESYREAKDTHFLSSLAKIFQSTQQSKRYKDMILTHPALEVEGNSIPLLLWLS